MKSVKFTLLVILSFVAAISGQETLRECGQIISANSGTIEYKLGETYDKFEACAFIVRVQNFSYIKFTLEESGISGRDRNAITIMGFNENNHTATYTLGPPNTELEAEVKGSIAVVIFRSWSISGFGKGFRLGFEGIGGSLETIPGFDMVFNNEKFSPLEIPFSNNFTNVASTNLMVFTNEAHMMTEVGDVFTMNLSGHVMEDPYCWDFFSVYSFTYVTSPVLEQTICDMNTATTEFLTGGIFIVLFRNYGGRFTSATVEWGIDYEYYTD
ncbi:unnamed protein product [Orchesella dallaii]|uniref:CUB domain-containing protein n=1 Tax=Orchesella dallaii TaxID=48710 RepID=A0ABP1RLZ7_9HEXA